MKKKLFIYSLALLTIELASCSQEDDFTPTGKDTPISIASVGVGDVVATRGMGYTVDENDIMTEAESAITLYVSSEKGDKYTADKIKFKLSDGIWTAVDAGATVYYEGTGSSQKFAALYCFAGIDASLSNPWETINNMSDAPSKDEQLARMDYLICNGDVTDATLDIAFKHIYAKLSFDVMYGSELEGKTINTLTVTGLPKAIKQNIFTGEYNYDGVEFTGETNFESANYLHGLMLPYTSKDALTYGITVNTTDGRYFTTTFKPERTENGVTTYGFEAGYAYTVNLKVGLDKIEVTSVDTGESNPWGTGWENETELN